MTEEEIRTGVRELAENYGDWCYDIPLPHGIWTGGGRGIPHTRLKRIVQIIDDLVSKPFSQCRILDLGSLEGQFSIELAMQGAETVGIEIREANIVKAKFVKEAMHLNNVAFFQDDARRISEARYGRFDAIVCSGLLYHLAADDAIDLVKRMHRMASRVVIIDTHIALKPERKHGPYYGHPFREHGKLDSAMKRESRRWASADNETSFWFTRPSLVNILTKAGFTSVFECFTPAHINFGRPGIESRDRCTFVAVQGDPTRLATSPTANALQEDWPEGSLSYQHSLSSRAKRALSRLVGK